MTNRARGLLFLGLIGLFVGAIHGQAALAGISLTTFIWVLVEWHRFQIRVRVELPQIHFERLVNGRNQASGSLWAGRKIRIEIRLLGKLDISPTMQVRDVVPDILELLPNAADGVSGRISFESIIGWDRPRWLRRGSSLDKPSSARLPNEWVLDSSQKEAHFAYTAMGRAAGELCLPGLRLTLSDAYGLFQHHRFVELPQSFHLLPNFYQSGEMRPTVKRHNSLPRSGIHRLQRAGSGSELLDLREYVAGDPPKAIAWKVSARRGKLMTRKYESEVPVRVQLFVDGSNRSRVGGYGYRLLDQINYIAASVANAATSVGDPVSGTLVDEERVTRLRWLSGDRGFLELLKRLAEFSCHRLPPADGVTAQMVESVLGVCHERYPRMLDRQYHLIPFSVYAARRQRFRIAGVLAEVLNLTPRQHVECCYDDSRLAPFLHEFLSHVGTPWMPPLWSTRDSGKSDTLRITRLSEAIGRAITHAHDNEVFVVFSDLLQTATDSSQLMRVLKLAVGKHHRVVVVCPTTTVSRPTAEPIRPSSGRLQDLLRAAEQTRIRESAIEMKRELIRLGIVVSVSGEPEAIQMVMDEIDMARGARARPQGARR